MGEREDSQDMTLNQGLAVGRHSAVTPRETPQQDRAAPRTEAAVSEFVSFEGTPEEHQRARAMAARFAGDRDRLEAAPALDRRTEAAVAKARGYLRRAADLVEPSAEYTEWLTEGPQFVNLLLWQLDHPETGEAAAAPQIDVERLAVALESAAQSSLLAFDIGPADLPYVAEHIIREYARLTPPPVAAVAEDRPMWAHTAANDPAGLYDDNWEPRTDAGDRDRREARIAELEAALLEFGQHGACAVWTETPVDINQGMDKEDPHCTCGFRAALLAAPGQAGPVDE